MKTIETTAKIGPDRRLVVDLPEEVSEGDHRVFIMFLDDEEAPTDQPPDRDDAERCLEWENGLLVYTGKIPANLDIRRMIELDRERRMLDILIGNSG